MSLPLRPSPRSTTQSSRSKALRCWHEPLTMTVSGLLIAMGVRSAIASPVYIPSESMQPTLAVNDTLLTEKLSYRFHAPVRGDIVVFAAPAQTLTACHVAPGTQVDLIKRVIAVAGDRVAVSFYEARNLLNFGYDPDREMVYFEYGLLNPPRREEDEDVI